MKEWAFWSFVTLWVILFVGTPDLHDKIMGWIDRQGACQSAEK